MAGCRRSFCPSRQLFRYFSKPSGLFVRFFSYLWAAELRLPNTNSMRKANAIKFTIYFLLFAVILYFEYYAIEMQGGEWIAHDDRRPLTSMMALIGICPIYILYDIAIRNTLCRLSALLLQAVFNLWSLLWFSALPTLGTYEAEYERTGVLPENMIPSDENNFYFCWIVGAIIMTYLTVVMIISYAMKLYADSKQLNHPNSD